MKIDRFSAIEPLEARIAPAVFTVTSLADPTDPGKVTLRDALMMADNHPGLDTIVFKLPAPPANGENIIILDGSALTTEGDVNIVGPGAGNLVINGNGASGVFVINNNDPTKDSPTAISGLEITGGLGTNGTGIKSLESLTLNGVVISGNTSTGSNGGIYVGSFPTPVPKVVISNSLITGNDSAEFSGGMGLYNIKSILIANTVVSGNFGDHKSGGGLGATISNNGAGMLIRNCVFSNNAASYGGGLFLADNNAEPASKITIAGTRITGNTSTNIGPKGGGGVYIETGNTVITNSVIAGNSAFYDGGGLYSKSLGSLTISSSIVTGNQTTTLQDSGGGGVDVSGGVSLPSVKVIGSSFSNNKSARYGGGIFASDVALTISNSNFIDNRASIAGGGAAVTDINLIVAGGSFSDNLVTGSGMGAQGGGIFALGTGAVTVRGATVAGNTASIGGGIFTAGPVSLTLTTANVTGNFASFGDGGGIYSEGSAALSVTSSKLTGNTAVADGGGIFVHEATEVTIKNDLAMGNTGTYGGGIEIRLTVAFTITGGAFTGNIAPFGGGLYLNSSEGTVKGVTISGNLATVQGGGVFQMGGAVMLQIAKVTGNFAPLDPNISGTYTKI